MDLNAIKTLEKAREKYVYKGDFGPSSNSARAVIDFFTLNADYAFPIWEIAQKSVAIFEINHGNAESRGVNKESVRKALKKMCYSRGDNKIIRVHHRDGVAVSGIYELNY